METADERVEEESDEAEDRSATEDWKDDEASLEDESLDVEYRSAGGAGGVGSAEQALTVISGRIPTATNAERILVGQKVAEIIGGASKEAQ